ncbi:hypothetical protein [Thermococcus sp.]
MEVELERIRVFFPASLEIQEELLKEGLRYHTIRKLEEKRRFR